MMNKTSIILKYFQKKDQLTVEDREYQQTISTFFTWLIDNDKVNHDKTTIYFPNISSKASIVTKQEGILSGIEEIEFLLKKFTPLSFKPQFRDGSQFKNGDVIAEIKGKSHEILGYERTILNILQRMSGIATETARLVTLINPIPYTLYPKPYLAATRKTPWMGLDKKAVSVGGGLTHRLNLSDGILVKDNHLSYVSIEEAIKIFSKRSHLRGGATSKELIEIEVETDKEVISAIKTYLEYSTTNNLAILLDNFTPKLAKLTLTNLKKDFNLSSIIFEASGGIDEKNILEWANTGVDIISMGSLTHSVKTTNRSLELVTK